MRSTRAVGSMFGLRPGVLGAAAEAAAAPAGIGDAAPEGKEEKRSDPVGEERREEKKAEEPEASAESLPYTDAEITAAKATLLEWMTRIRSLSVDNYELPMEQTFHLCSAMNVMKKVAVFYLHSSARMPAEGWPEWSHFQVYWRDAPEHHRQFPPETRGREKVTLLECMWLAMAYKECACHPDALGPETCKDADIETLTNRLSALRLHWSMLGARELLAPETIDEYKGVRSQAISFTVHGASFTHSQMMISPGSGAASSSAATGSDIARKYSNVNIIRMLNSWLPLCVRLIPPLDAMYAVMSETPELKLTDDQKTNITRVATAIERYIKARAEVLDLREETKRAIVDFAFCLDTPVGSVDFLLRDPVSVMCTYDDLYKSEVDGEVKAQNQSADMRNEARKPVRLLINSTETGRVRFAREACALMLYGYNMQNAAHGTEFAADYILPQANTRAMISTLASRVRKGHGRPRSPVIFQFGSNYCVHTWLPDPSGGITQHVHVACNAYEAMAVWTVLVSEKFAGVIDSGVDLRTRWLNRFSL